MKRNGTSRPIWFFIGLLFSVALAFISFKIKKAFLTELFALISVGTVVSLCITYFRYAGKARNIYRDYLFRPSFAKVLGLQAEVQREMSILMKCWSEELGKKRLVLMVDDIDRCPEDLIIKIVDALRVMLEDEQIAARMIIFVSMDDRILRRAIRHKFHALYGETTHSYAAKQQANSLEDEPLDDLASEYIDKLFISGIRLGDLTPQEMNKMLDVIMDSLPAEKTIKVLKEKKSPQNIEEVAIIQTPNNTTPATQSPQESNSEMSDDRKAAIKPAPMVLAHFEEERFRKFITKSRTLTPRQIKIIYYRYLLARTILMGLCEEAGLPFNWLEGDNNEIFIELLIFYSQNENKQSLEEERRRFAGITYRLCKVTARQKTEVPTEQYGLLLDTLNMVIAY